MFKLGIIGCGLVARKRAKQIGENYLRGVTDIDSSRGKQFAQEFNTEFYQSSEALIPSCDIIIIATPNHLLTPLALKVVEQGKSVLIEKPGAISLKELLELQAAATNKRVSVKVGFNHRFHPSILKMKEMVDAKSLGDLLFLKASYGHGGRIGYDKEWRANRAISGGGELMDQGVHLLDIIYSLFGPLPLQSSFVTTSFWNMPVDDNAVLTLSDKKCWATFQVSCSEWKNTFRLELYGRTGKILIQGLGGSYGKETLTYYKMLPEMGPPETESFDWDFDDSWGKDLANLTDHIEKGTPLLGDLNSAAYCLENVEKAYAQNFY